VINLRNEQNGDNGGDLIFEVTDRVSHQLVTRIVAILIQNIFDFEKIIISDKLQHGLEKVANDSDLPEYVAEYYPLLSLQHESKAAMNLEVRITPGSHGKFPDGVYEGASLSVKDLVRFGLFYLSSYETDIKPNETKFTSYNDFIDKSENKNHRFTMDFFKADPNMENTIKLHWEDDGFNMSNSPPQCISTTEP
jgi:hypothetical protein